MNIVFPVSFSPPLPPLRRSRHSPGATHNERLDPGEPEKTVAVDWLYLETNGPTVRDRLVRAGVRLAGLLNEVLGR